MPLSSAFSAAAAYLPSVTGSALPRYDPIPSEDKVRPSADFQWRSWAFGWFFAYAAVPSAVAFPVIIAGILLVAGGPDKLDRRVREQVARLGRQLAAIAERRLVAPAGEGLLRRDIAHHAVRVAGHPRARGMRLLLDAQAVLDEVFGRDRDVDHLVEEDGLHLGLGRAFACDFVEDLLLRLVVEAGLAEALDAGDLALHLVVGHGPVGQVQRLRGARELRRRPELHRLQRLLGVVREHLAGLLHGLLLAAHGVRVVDVAARALEEQRDGTSLVLHGLGQRAGIPGAERLVAAVVAGMTGEVHDAAQQLPVLAARGEDRDFRIDRPLEHQRCRILERAVALGVAVAVDHAAVVARVEF